MKARVKKNEHDEITYSDLTVGHTYTILGIEGDDYRILSDEERPYLYPTALFEILDPTEPRDWITDYGAEGERYSYPQELARSGFFEDYFDRQPEVVNEFREYLARLFRSVSAK